MQRIIIIILAFLLLGTMMAFKRKKRFSSNNKPLTLMEWYNALLSTSIAFLEEEKNEDFKKNVHIYIDTCTVYKFSNHDRLESYICQPIIFNKNFDKAIILVLTRSFDLSKNRVEYIHYISAKIENGKWLFKVKFGHSDSFGYYKNSPTISDTEIGINILDRLVQYGYMDSREINNDTLFNSEMYILK
jgi:hypothetical protein